jgi:hypothetical protein
MYYQVYDPKGEPFEVTAGRLHDLIVVRQWTFWPPTESKPVFKETPCDQHEEGTSDVDC